MMATIRFYEELNDFPGKDKQKTSYYIKTGHGQTVKDLIESENVPHTEVDYPKIEYLMKLWRFVR